MKVDVMTEVFEILKKGQGTDTDIEALSNKEKCLKKEIFNTVSA